MKYKFKVGDRVRIKEEARFVPLSLLFFIGATVGDEGIVTKLEEGMPGDGGIVVDNEKFKSGNPEEYGEHGIWLREKFLELVS